MRIQRRFVVACLITTNHFASHAQEGSLDPTLDPGVGPNQTIRAIAIRPDGRILVGGWFYEVNGSVCNRIICLNTDGSLYAGFNSGTGPTDPVECIALQADGKVLMGGSFTTDDGIDENGIARLNSNGILDAAFNAGSGANAPVHAIALEPGGKILIGGMFTSFDGTPRDRIDRLNVDGSLDASFDPGTGANGTIDEMVVQMDGKILIAGSFTLFNGTARNRIARLDPDGSLDITFDPGSGASASVFALAAQPDGRVLIGGSFTSYNGLAMNRLAPFEP